MFRNYLTYNIALNFHRSCLALGLPQPVQERLTSSAEIMIHHFARSIHTTDRKEELKFLCVALLSLRDCKEILDGAGPWPVELQGRYTVLHGRLEQICLKAAEAEGGQLRMFG